MTQKDNINRVKIIAWIAFVLVFISFFTPCCLLQVFVQGGSIATMKALRLVYVSGMALGVALALACLVMMILKKIFFSSAKAIIVSLLAILLGGFGIISHIDTWDTNFGREEATNRAVCMTHLRRIETAMCMYSEVHDGAYPEQDNWRQTLIKEGYIHKKDIECFICPSVGGDPQKETSYIYRGPASSSGPGDWVILHDRKNNHSYPVPDSQPRFGRNVVLGAHAVQFVTETEFQELIRKENAERKDMGLPTLPAEN